MSLFIRKIVFCYIGLIAGLAAWPMSELIASYQADFPSYLVFSILMGAAFGLVMGGFFGTIESITLSIRAKFVSGLVSGMLIGCLGGIIGYLVGQSVLFFMTEVLSYSNKIFHAVAVPIARMVGWGAMGMIIGSIDGIRTRSLNKVKIGLLGGLIGGMSGGGILEYIRVSYPELSLGRLAGFLSLGLFIGLFYSIFEKYFSRGVLKLLNGSGKGKEFLLVQRCIQVGKAKKSDILLETYTGVSDIHAKIQVKGNTVIIKSNSSTHPVVVNEEPIMEHQLKFEDVIQIGNAKFMFFYK